MYPPPAPPPPPPPPQYPPILQALLTVWADYSGPSKVYYYGETLIICTILTYRFQALFVAALYVFSYILNFLMCGFALGSGVLFG